jgi:hypothetical protein
LDLGGGHGKFMIRLCTRKFQTTQGGNCKIDYLCLDKNPDSLKKFYNPVGTLTTPEKLVADKGHKCEVRVVTDYLESVKTLGRFDIILVNNVTFPLSRYKEFMDVLTQHCDDVISIINMDGDMVKFLPTGYNEASFTLEDKIEEPDGSVKAVVRIGSSKFTEHLVTSSQFTMPNVKYTARDFMIQYGGMGVHSPCSTVHSFFCVREIKTRAGVNKYNHELRYGKLPQGKIVAKYAGLNTSLPGDIRTGSADSAKWTVAEDMFVSVKLDGIHCHTYYDLNSQFFCFRDGTQYSIPRLKKDDVYDTFVGNLEFFGTKRQDHIEGAFVITDVFECNGLVKMHFWEELKCAQYIAHAYPYFGVKRYFARDEVAQFAAYLKSSIRYDGFVFRSAAIRNHLTMNASFYVKPFMAIDVSVSGGVVVHGPSRFIGHAVDAPPGLHEVLVNKDELVYQRPRPDKSHVTTNREVNEYNRTPSCHMLLGRFFGVTFRPILLHEFAYCRNGEGFIIRFDRVPYSLNDVWYDLQTNTFRSANIRDCSTPGDVVYYMSKVASCASLVQ